VFPGYHLCPAPHRMDLTLDGMIIWWKDFLSWLWDMVNSIQRITIYNVAVQGGDGGCDLD